MLMTSCFGGSTPILGRERITLLQPKESTTPYSVSVVDVTVSALYFARRYEHQLPIVIALSIFSDGHFSYVIEPASGKGEGPSK